MKTVDKPKQVQTMYHKPMDNEIEILEKNSNNLHAFYKLLDEGFKPSRKILMFSHLLIDEKGELNEVHFRDENFNGIRIKIPNFVYFDDIDKNLYKGYQICGVYRISPSARCPVTHTGWAPKNMCFFNRESLGANHETLSDYKGKTILEAINSIKERYQSGRINNIIDQPRELGKHNIYRHVGAIREEVQVDSDYIVQEGDFIWMETFVFYHNNGLSMLNENHFILELERNLRVTSLNWFTLSGKEMNPYWGGMKEGAKLIYSTDIGKFSIHKRKRVYEFGNVDIDIDLQEVYDELGWTPTTNTTCERTVHFWDYTQMNKFINKLVELYRK